jgi:hypothetical protein
MKEPRDAGDMSAFDFDTRLRGEHLQGKAWTMTIRAVMVEETHPQPGKPGVDALVVYFEKSAKGLVLSPTNRHALAGMFGDKIRDWYGKRVTLEAREVTVGGRRCLPIHVGLAAQVNHETGEVIEAVGRNGRQGG